MGCEPTSDKGSRSDLLRVHEQSYMFDTSHYLSFVGLVLGSRVVLRFDFPADTGYCSELCVKMHSGPWPGNPRTYTITIDILKYDGVFVHADGASPMKHNIVHNIDDICAHLKPGLHIDVNGERLFRMLAYVVLRWEQTRKYDRGL